MSHLKFETAKGGKPKFLIPTSKEEHKLLQTEERQVFMTQDGREAAYHKSLGKNMIPNKQQAVIPNTTYAQRNRRNRYLLANNNPSAYDHYQPRESNSVENKPSTLNPMLIGDGRPPRMLKVMDKYTFDQRGRSIAVEGEEASRGAEIAYPTTLNGQGVVTGRRGRNYSSLMPASKTNHNGRRQRGESNIDQQRRSLFQ